MQFELTYAVRRTFEIPDGATDEEYDAMKASVITGIVCNPELHAVEGTVTVRKLNTPPKEQPKYETNPDAVD